MGPGHDSLLAVSLSRSKWRPCDTAQRTTFPECEQAALGSRTQPWIPGRSWPSTPSRTSDRCGGSRFPHQSSCPKDSISEVGSAWCGGLWPSWKSARCTSPASYYYSCCVLVRFDRTVRVWLYWLCLFKRFKRLKSPMCTSPMWLLHWSIDSFVKKWILTLMLVQFHFWMMSASTVKGQP